MGAQGDYRVSARALLAFAGHTDPTPEQVAGAEVLALLAADVHAIARWKQEGK